MEKKETCHNVAKKTQVPCQKSECRYHIDSSSEYNCAILAAENGPMTLQEIGDIFGVSRMRICQIEKSILEKLKRSNSIFEDFK